MTTDKERWDAGVDKYGAAPFGLAVNVALAKGQRLSEALRSAERDIELTRLRDAVVEAAIEEYKIDHAADRGSNTITRTDALIKMQPAMQARREAVAALLEFEAKEIQK